MKQLLMYIAWTLILVFTVGCQAVAQNEPPSIKYKDLIGRWVADYSQYDIPLPHGKEVLVLSPNGTFEQIFEPTIGQEKIVTGKWSTEEVNNGWTRIYLVGASYYLEGLLATQDPNFGVRAWDPVLRHHVSIGNKSGFVILYATRLPWNSKYDSKIPCGEKGEVILQHLPIGDLDAPTWVTFCKK